MLCVLPSVVCFTCVWVRILVQASRACALCFHVGGPAMKWGAMRTAPLVYWVLACIRSRLA